MPPRPAWPAPPVRPAPWPRIRRDHRADLRLARRLIAKYPLHRYERLAPLMRRLWAVKSPAEVALLRRAVDITGAVGVAAAGLVLRRRDATGR
jgi:Xaa-Pro aminopeptidase